MKTITVENLKGVLLNLKGSQFVTISALVEARSRKTGNPYKAIYKLSKVNGISGADYENSVNNQLEREGKENDFSAGERSWGTRISPTLVENKGKSYLAMHVQKTSKPTYLVDKNSMLTVIDKKKIENFIIQPSKPTQGGVEKNVIYRNYSLENIKYIAIGGEKYRVR